MTPQKGLIRLHYSNKQVTILWKKTSKSRIKTENSRFQTIPRKSCSFSTSPGEGTFPGPLNISLQVSKSCWTTVDISSSVVVGLLRHFFLIIFSPWPIASLFFRTKLDSVFIIQKAINVCKTLQHHPTRVENPQIPQAEMRFRKIRSQVQRTEQMRPFWKVRQMSCEFSE